VREADHIPTAAESAYSAEGMSERLDSSLENVFPDDPGRRDSLPPDLAAQWRSSGSGSGAQNGGTDYPDIESVTAARPTLYDHVSEQIAFTFVDPTDRAIARVLADGLDEAGYLDVDTSELARRLGVAETDLERILRSCQT